MKIIVAGTRDCWDYMRVDWWLRNHEPFGDFELVTGMCPDSPDEFALWWAEDTGRIIHKFPADWKKFGKVAGIIRNQEMASFADGLIAFWDGSSTGTRNMIELMLYREHKPIHVVFP